MSRIKKNILLNIIKEEIYNVLRERLVINRFFINLSLEKLEHIKKIFKNDIDINNALSKAIDLIKNYNKNKINLKEISYRGAFVIDWNGKIHDVNYHGDVFYKPGFEKLLKNAIKLANNNSSILKSMIENGDIKLSSILDDAGCIRGGIWSKSKHQLYFTINSKKATDKAKIGAIEKISLYKPTSIYVEDLLNQKNDGYMQADEFAGEYL